MSRQDDKYIDMEVALTDEWLKQGKLRELTFADAIKYGYEQAKQDLMDKAKQWFTDNMPSEKVQLLWCEFEQFITEN
mgnify:CR=1 FL=1